MADLLTSKVAPDFPLKPANQIMMLKTLSASLIFSCVSYLPFEYNWKTFVTNILHNEHKVVVSSKPSKTVQQLIAFLVKIYSWKYICINNI